MVRLLSHPLNTWRVAGPARDTSDLLSLSRSLSHSTFLISAPISIFANPNNYDFKDFVFVRTLEVGILTDASWLGKFSLCLCKHSK